jgi:hypothetical protein
VPDRMIQLTRREVNKVDKEHLRYCRPRLPAGTLDGPDFDGHGSVIRDATGDAAK